MRVDQASRLVAAEPAAVFRAFVEPDLFAAWLPPEGMTGRLERFDARVGGGYRLVLAYESASGRGKFSEHSDVAEARIVALDPPTRIVWAVEFPSDDPAFAGTMTMEWDFEPTDAATRVTVRASDVPPGIDPDDHAAGLASSLAQLATLYEVAQRGEGSQRSDGA